MKILHSSQHESHISLAKKHGTKPSTIKLRMNAFLPFYHDPRAISIYWKMTQYHIPGFQEKHRLLLLPWCLRPDLRIIPNICHEFRHVSKSSTDPIFPLFNWISVNTRSRIHPHEFLTKTNWKIPQEIESIHPFCCVHYKSARSAPGIHCTRPARAHAWAHLHLMLTGKGMRITHGP